MEFELSRVYTSVNANELNAGSECIFANCLDTLKSQVEANSYPTYIQKLDCILGISSTNRFESGDKTYNLAYLISEPNRLKWTDLKVGDIIVTRRKVIEVDKSDITKMHIKINVIDDSVFDEWITDEDLASNWEKEELTNKSSVDIITRLLMNSPNNYLNGDVELNQIKMFNFNKAVNDAEEFLKSHYSRNK